MNHKYMLWFLVIIIAVLLAVSSMIQQKPMTTETDRPGSSANEERITSPPISIDLTQSQFVNDEFQRLRQALAESQQHILALDQRIQQLEAQSSHSAASEVELQPDFESENDATTRLQRRMREIGMSESNQQLVTDRLAEYDLASLYLRDTAKREGWHGTQRYQDELSKINNDGRNLRTELGDDAYDQYLFASEQPNRVEVISVIPGSQAEAAGVQAGDWIVSYAGERIFSPGRLQQATGQGNPGESVLLGISRNNSPLGLVLPRGPIGVKLKSVLAQP